MYEPPWLAIWAGTLWYQVQTQLKENRDQMIPMQEQLKVLQENEDKANAEMTALKADNARWRNR